MSRIAILFILLASQVAGAIQVDILDRKTHTEISIHGSFKKTDSKVLDAKYKTAGKSNKKISLWLTSQGGVLQGVGAIHESLEKIIEAEFKKYKKPTPFVIYEECASLCHLIASNIAKKFPASEGKVLFLTANETRFYFHQPTDSEGNAFMGAELDKRMEKFNSEFTKSGVNVDWLNENRELFKSIDGKTLSGEKVCKGKSEIVPSDSCRAKEDIPDLVERAIRP